MKYHDNPGTTLVMFHEPLKAVFPQVIVWQWIVAATRAVAAAESVQ